jgi:hypothetical protein
VINLASITSYLPMAYSAVYAASKSFVLSFSEALGREMAAAGVHVLAICPGPVATGFYEQLGANPPGKALDTPERVVADALKAFDRRRRVVIPGRFRIRALAFGTRLLPRALNARIGEKIARQYFLAPEEKGGRGEPSATTPAAQAVGRDHGRSTWTAGYSGQHSPAVGRAESPRPVVPGPHRRRVAADLRGEDHGDRHDFQRHAPHPDHAEAVRRVHRRTREALARGPALAIGRAHRLEPSAGPAPGTGRRSHRAERLRLLPEAPARPPVRPLRPGSRHAAGQPDLVIDLSETGREAHHRLLTELLTEAEPDLGLGLEDAIDLVRLCDRAERMATVEPPYPFGRTPAFLTDDVPSAALLGLYF